MITMMMTQEPTPGVLGHEGCGEVVRSARPGISAGERLTFSVTDVCGKCEFSRRVMVVMSSMSSRLAHQAGTSAEM